MYHNDFEPFERNTENLTESEPMSAYGQPQQTAPGYTPQHGSYAEEPVHYEPYNTTAEPQGGSYAEANRRAEKRRNPKRRSASWQRLSRQASCCPALPDSAAATCFRS